MIPILQSIGPREPIVSEQEQESMCHSMPLLLASINAWLIQSFPLKARATNEFYWNKEWEAISKTEWHQSVVDVVRFA